MNRVIVIIISLVYILFMGILAIMFIQTGETKKALVGVGGVVCGAIPLILALFTRLQFNMPIIISYFIFLIGSQYLGSVRGWYGLGWWDTFIHFISGGILAFTAIALYERLVHRRAGNYISSWFIFLFAFGFAALGGVLWETYEFSCDQFLGMTLQGGGNKDTMTDLIADIVGGLVIAIYSGIRTRVKRNNEISI